MHALLARSIVTLGCPAPRETTRRAPWPVRRGPARPARLVMPAAHSARPTRPSSCWPPTGRRPAGVTRTHRALCAPRCSRTAWPPGRHVGARHASPSLLAPGPEGPRRRGELLELVEESTRRRYGGRPARATHSASSWLLEAARDHHARDRALSASARQLVRDNGSRVRKRPFRSSMPRLLGYLTLTRDRLATGNQEPCRRSGNKHIGSFLQVRY